MSVVTRGGQGRRYSRVESSVRRLVASVGRVLVVGRSVGRVLVGAGGGEPEGCQYPLVNRRRAGMGLTTRRAACEELLPTEPVLHRRSADRRTTSGCRSVRTSCCRWNCAIESSSASIDSNALGDWMNLRVLAVTGAGRVTARGLLLLAVRVGRRGVGLAERRLLLLSRLTGLIRLTRLLPSLSMLTRLLLLSRLSLALSSLDLVDESLTLLGARECLCLVEEIHLWVERCISWCARSAWRAVDGEEDPTRETWSR